METHRFDREYVERQRILNKPKRNSLCKYLCCVYFSFADAKEEAFRFKYCPEKLVELENNMNCITWILYVNAILYYIICIFGPIIAAGECGHGIHYASHVFYT